MLTAEITMDTREDVQSVAKASVARVEAESMVRSKCDEMGASMLTYDLEALAGRYRTEAAKHLARYLFRMLVRSKKRQRELWFPVSEAKQ
jgi:hypothetical protein